MAKRRTVRTLAPARQPVSYPNPGADQAMRALELAVLSTALAPAQPGQTRHPELQRLAAEILARREADRRNIEHWKARRAAMQKRDRQVRRFWLGFGAVIAVALLAGLAVLGWLIWQALAAISLGVLAVPAVLLLAAALGVGGHRCITVVQHWH